MRRKPKSAEPKQPEPERPPRFQIWVHRVEEPAGDGERPRASIVITLLIGGSLAACATAGLPEVGSIAGIRGTTAIL